FADAGVLHDEDGITHERSQFCLVKLPRWRLAWLTRRPYSAWTRSCCERGSVAIIPLDLQRVRRQPRRGDRSTHLLRFSSLSRRRVSLCLARNETQKDRHHHTSFG